MEMTAFDVAVTPLERGVTLIEASAGTGKTYSIAALYLRLILERHLRVQKILAVTYTNAATRELRERIRKRLRDALRELRDPPEMRLEESSASGSGAVAPDPVVERFRAEGGDVRQAARELELAVQSFDEARIFTIHGFFQRVLQDHAFESGVRYDAELLTDSAPLFEEVADDFWRHTFYESEPLLAALAMARDLSPDDWAGLLKNSSNHPEIALLPALDPEPMPAIAAKLRELFGALCSEWERNGVEIGELLRNDPALGRDERKSFGPTRVRRFLDNLSELRNATGPTQECLERLPSLCTSFIERNCKRNQAAPGHPFFALCESFCAAVSKYFEQLTHAFFAYAKAELEARKLRRNVVTFEDLLSGMWRALQGASGPAVASSLGGQYEAALIDEFQDTDPLQYASFARLFAGGGHWLFFIGDPKQAIYGFRGADVFTYLTAAASAAHRYTLETNWRSDPLLLQAFNALFSRNEKAFVVEGIDYHPVHAPAVGNGSAKPQDCIPPLAFRYLRSSRASGEVHSKEEGVALSARAVAEDIALVSESGSRPMSDIAVLVRTGKQASAVQRALRESGIRSVLHTEESVFHTDEAEELQRVLEAVIEPRNDSRLKAALATRLLGCSAGTLAAMDADESLRDHWLGRFAEWRELWINGCFIAMARKLLVDEQVRRRLVESVGGERRLTNVLHLAELLHDEETSRQLSPEALCDWLCEQRMARRTASDAAQLRLESDGEAVVIVTVHKSKGLEYPVVYCPFLWQSADPPQHAMVQFHSEGRLTLDIRDRQSVPDEHKQAQRDEALAEETRLLYVAVTRAKHRCFIYAGDFRDTGKSALAHVLNAPDLLGGIEQLAATAPEAVSLSFVEPNGASACSVQNADRSNDTQPQSTDKPAAREFTGSLPKTAFITSFTGLTAGTGREEPERDLPVPVEELPEPGKLEIAAPPVVESVSPIFQFERGARAGDFFHDVLERLDFQNPGELDSLVHARLAMHGFAGTPYEEAIKEKLSEVLEVELQPGLTLRQIAREDRLSEVEFSCRLDSLRPDDLRSIFLPYASAALDPVELGRLRFSPVEGYLRGFIDLLFSWRGRYYVVDWKSNWLGNSPSDYDLPGVEACMRSHHYTLQAHLYVLAVDRFLAVRLPDYDYERHFGGVCYLFLRGIERRNPGRAIFRDRPAAGLVEALRRRMKVEL